MNLITNNICGIRENEYKIVTMKMYISIHGSTTNNREDRREFEFLTRTPISEMSTVC